MPDNSANSADRSPAAPYEVLARRHRPLAFSGLIGQETLVRTLENAFRTDRIAHAFLLAGIRGVGKTTTARIIARCLNCIGEDGKGGPTTTPCGVCEPCTAIAESRFTDVVEFDAASHTGVEKARELIENAHHRASWGRYKVYIIDEAHMLSTASFNALLKTLEEPPPHVKFILATTEIRKIPVTVLSRCQRFDLRRVESSLLIEHLKTVAGSEGARVEEDALALIARAAEGSVRDALSLLDQAIADCGAEITAMACRRMLGLADGGRMFDLFEHVCAGRTQDALREFGEQFADGADPVIVLGALAEICHGVSVLRVAPELGRHPGTTPEEAKRGRALAETLSPSILVRFWQILERALDEAQRSERPRLAADMAIIRLTHASTLPTPEALAQRLADSGSGPPGGVVRGGAGESTSTAQPVPSATAAGASPPEPVSVRTIEDVAELARRNGAHMLLTRIERHLRPVELGARRLVFVPDGKAPPYLARDLARGLREWTGEDWEVRAVDEGDAPTIAERRATAETALRARVLEREDVRAIKDSLPDGTVIRVIPYEDSHPT